MENQPASTTTPQDYLVEMAFSPLASLPSPQEIVAFTEKLVLPTLDALEKFVAAGRIPAGGAPLAATGLSFIARVSSPQELEQMVSGLPLWPRSQTRVVPLGTFGSRAKSIRGRLEAARAAAS